MAGEEGEEVTGLISVINADARRIPLADGVVQTVITSPPYWGLRDYGIAGQLGLEPTPEEYIANMVTVFREVWRVLRPDGTLWLNIGDCYATSPNGTRAETTKNRYNEWRARTPDTQGGRPDDRTFRDKPFSTVSGKLKPKDLVMMPARLALALQADGWWVRSDIIWAKPNPMPESVTDRPTKSHEYVFLLTKNEHYYYDAVAIRESGKLWAGQAGTFERDNGKATELQVPGQDHPSHRPNRKNGGGGYSKRYAEAQPAHGGESERHDTGYRNRRTVWTVATEPFSGAHFATFPQKLVEPMVLAGSSPQACETCGAPWERVTENAFIESGPKRNHISGDNAHGWEDSPRGTIITTSLYWHPTCACPPERNTGAGRCIVLDPFAGTCTVGRVAVKHGRRFVGLELKPEYIELARERTDRTQMVMQV